MCQRLPEAAKLFAHLLQVLHIGMGKIRAQTVEKGNMSILEQVAVNTWASNHGLVVMMRKKKEEKENKGCTKTRRQKLEIQIN